MNFKILIVALTPFLFGIINASNKKDLKNAQFNLEKDLLLLQVDCKTDVDDLQTLAAFATLISDPRFSKLNYHIISGTYGIQTGLYSSPNTLLELAFTNNWTDADENLNGAIANANDIVKRTLNNQGNIWIAEAGQSDFSAKLIKSVIADIPTINTSKRIHIIQHSKWNEKVTSEKSLAFVKKHTDYQKIPDGNTVGNGTPGFRSSEYSQWKTKIKSPELMEIWQLSVDLSNKYNGKDGRYNNEAIAAGGVDFSDLSEVCWILNLQDFKDVDSFFMYYSKF